MYHHTEASKVPDPRRRKVLACLATALPALYTYPTLSARRGLKPFDPRPPAPKLRLISTDGTAYGLRDFVGRVVVVNFWSLWCLPCKAEMPSLQAIFTELKSEGLTVWGVAVGDDPQAVSQYGAQYRLSFPLLPDPERKASDRWSVAALPTTDVIDKQGRIAFRMVGEAAWNADPMRQHLKDLLLE